VRYGHLVTRLEDAIKAFNDNFVVLARELEALDARVRTLEPVAPESPPPG
jgi:hypothetical protein